MQFELDLIHWLQTFRSTFMDYFVQFWTLFGEELIIIGILGFLYWCYDKVIGEKVGVAVFVSLVLNSVIKVLVARPRPFLADDTITNIRPSTATGYAFPSGHTQGAATVFTSFACWLKKKWITISSIVIIVMVAVSRMYLGAHYLSDVLVGATLGIAISIGFYFYFKKVTDNFLFYKQILYAVAMIFLASYLFYLFTANAVGDESNALAMYNSLEGVAKMLGAITGFVIGIWFEKKRVNFTNHSVLWKNAIRFILGVAIVMIIRIALKEVFSLIVNPEELEEGALVASSLAVIFDFLRYFAMVFIGIGIYPLLFRKAKL